VISNKQTITRERSNSELVLCVCGCVSYNDDDDGYDDGCDVGSGGDNDDVTGDVIAAENRPLGGSFLLRSTRRDYVLLKTCRWSIVMMRSTAIANRLVGTSAEPPLVQPTLMSRSTLPPAVHVALEQLSTTRTSPSVR